ncbi:MAG: hypothetical protein H8E31_10110 [Planctomycetes bacterium]|nr:hypothetical protein [Planctomycetota bacterium]
MKSRWVLPLLLVPPVAVFALDAAEQLALRRPLEEAWRPVEAYLEQHPDLLTFDTRLAEPFAGPEPLLAWAAEGPGERRSPEEDLLGFWGLPLFDENEALQVALRTPASAAAAAEAGMLLAEEYRRMGGGLNFVISLFYERCVMDAIDQGRVSLGRQPLADRRFRWSDFVRAWVGEAELARRQVERLASWKRLLMGADADRISVQNARLARVLLEHGDSVERLRPALLAHLEKEATWRPSSMTRLVHPDLAPMSRVNFAAWLDRVEGWEREWQALLAGEPLPDFVWPDEGR